MAAKLKLSSLRANLERERMGDWVDYPVWPGVRFNVSALTKPEYETARDLMYKRLRQKHPIGVIPREVLSPALGAIYCEHILHGWEGLDVEYSPEVARETLSDPEYREVVAAVEFCALKLSEVDPDYVRAEEKN